MPALWAMGQPNLAVLFLNAISHKACQVPSNATRVGCSSLAVGEEWRGGGGGGGGGGLV